MSLKIHSFPSHAIAPLLTAVVMALAAAGAQALTIANFGGANGKAQEIAFVTPFSRSHKVPARGVEYTGDLTTVRTMVKTGKIEWDVIEVESTDLIIGCEAGLFERLDRASVTNSSFVMPGAIQECGVGAFVWSTIMAYDANRLKEVPRGWKDFWDTSRFPGKRGLRKGARYNLEIALMADGVGRRDVYTELATPAGQNRAFAKLEALKPYIVWWESGSQPPQRLASGETTMSTAFNGRIAAANHTTTTQLSIAWLDAIYELDYWAIVKGTPQRELALSFIGFATSEEAQLAFSREIPYGPTNFNAILRYDHGRTRPSDATQVVDLSMASSDLPSAPGNLRRSLPMDANFWLTHGSALEKRFSEKMY